MPRKPKKYHYIYKTTCITTGKFYVGMHSTDNLDDGYLGSGKILRYSINKHGKESHAISIIEFAPDRKTLGIREAQIVSGDLILDPMCMNLRYGGDGGSNGHSSETRRKISESRKGLKHSKPWPKHSREKASLARIGISCSEQTRSKISQSRVGKAMSAQTKSRISETLKQSAQVIAERQRNNISGRHFYNDGNTVILVFPDDPRLSDGKWIKGKSCK